MLSSEHENFLMTSGPDLKSKTQNVPVHIKSIVLSTMWKDRLKEQKKPETETYHICKQLWCHSLIQVANIDCHFTRHLICIWLCYTYNPGKKVKTPDNSAILSFYGDASADPYNAI